MSTTYVNRGDSQGFTLTLDRRKADGTLQREDLSQWTLSLELLESNGDPLDPPLIKTVGDGIVLEGDNLSATALISYSEMRGPGRYKVRSRFRLGSESASRIESLVVR